MFGFYIVTEFISSFALGVSDVSEVRTTQNESEMRSYSNTAAAYYKKGGKILRTKFHTKNA